MSLAEGTVCNAREHGLKGDGVTNDQPALQALVDALGEAYAADGRPRVIHCPPGTYSIRDAGTVWRSGISLTGAGIGVTRFVLSNEGNRVDPTPLAYFTTVQHGASRDNCITDCTFASFEIDGSGVKLARYDYLAKGLGLQYVQRGRFRDLYIHDTAATGLGCDFLQDTTVEAVHVLRCGRLDTGQQMGGAGIGIGVGGWGDSERLTVANCTAVGNGTNGIFLELQKPDWVPPRGIRIVGCHVEDNRFGISDWGAEGLIVSACTMIGNHEAGFDVSAQGTSGVAGRGGIVADCVIDANIIDGLSIGNTPGRYVVRGNRISRNGRYGYCEHNLARNPIPGREVVLDGNEIWENGLDGIRIDAGLSDGAIVNNRIRDNGRRSAGGDSGAGEAVSYTRTSVRDSGADWPVDGHRGKVVRIGPRSAVVATNTSNELLLAPVRPGATTAWTGGTPSAGERYELPEAPTRRAGITLASTTSDLTLRHNRVWDSQERKTQTHGLLVTGEGPHGSADIQDNDFACNAVAATRIETPEYA
ncbi:parallel beta helix pectate lyase-like protein [Micromonospora pisi]|uniref:Parallel beta helix pectate lyase-like protein n=1 Tax=Micromonospora pisi TaxID=589240 RepID=A0A495JRY6_9ACTN|nr:right-handed parallel beta-helix repeat-containing protein [Micromonospora pisi]RKR91142.1 parallel beta helix pectate lyase-like protein [Micromonospora pisi]